jgi:hypothetical protein
MSWIKRNLYFLVFSVLAVALMGLAGWYLYDKWQLSNDITAKLNEQYEKLGRLNGEKPHPGSRDIDNIQAAKDQRQQLTNYIQQARNYFQRVPAIPNSPKVNSQDFTAALRRTLDQLQRDAVGASVNLPPDAGGYSFSFAAEKPRVTFAAGSLAPLSVQLGEIKAICDVLFLAKINSLDNVRRERVSADDANGPATDYLTETSTTNDLAVLTPYELTFRCFSSELASVLAGFASSPFGLVVKNINVELASASTVPGAFGTEPGANPGAYPGAYPQMQVPPTAPPPQPAALGAYAAPVPGARGGLPTVLDEKQLKVTLMLNVVKLLPPK